MTNQQTVPLTIAAALTIANLCIAISTRHHRIRAEAAAQRAAAARARIDTANRLLAKLAPTDAEEPTP